MLYAVVSSAYPSKDISSGWKKLKKTEISELGSLPVVDQGKQYIAGYTDDKSIAVKNNKPVVIFGDHTRNIKYVDFDFAVGADGVKIFEAKEDVLPRFLYYFICQLNVPDIGYNRHYKYLKDEFIPLPPLAEQKRITGILDKADEIRKKRQQSIKECDEFLKATFLDMFGDPLTNPKGWGEKKFINIVKLQRGHDLPNASRRKGDIPVYGSNGVLGSHDKHKFANGVITGRSGSIGNVFYSKGSFWPLNTTLYSVELYLNNPIYLKHLLEHFKLKRFYNGTGVPTLNRNIVHDKNIFDIPIPLQEKFAKIVEKTEAMKTRMQESAAELDNNFNNLMQRAFKGEL